MSAQQNQNPDEQRQLEDLRRQMRDQRPTSPPIWRSIWLWPVVIVLVAILWYGFWGGGWFSHRQSEGANNVTPTPSNQLAQNNNQPVTATKQNGENGSALLNAANKQPYVGQSFEIANTPVLRKVSDSVFWLGSNNDPAPLLVVLASRAENSANADLRPGEMVNVIGQVQKAPTVQQATQQWHLNQTGAERLQHEGAYIQASETEPLQK